MKGQVYQYAIVGILYVVIFANDLFGFDINSSLEIYVPEQTISITVNNTPLSHTTNSNSEYYDQEQTSLNVMTPPSLTLPAPISVNNDPGSCSAVISSNLQAVYNDPEPTDGDTITSLTWEMTGATTGSSPANGINQISSPNTFNVGVTTINIYHYRCQ